MIGDRRRELDRFIAQSANSALGALNRKYDAQEGLDDLYRIVGRTAAHRTHLDATPDRTSARNCARTPQKPWLSVAGSLVAAVAVGIAAAILATTSGSTLLAALGTAGSATALTFGSVLTTLRFLRSRP
jgi:hypothetical protein